MQTLSQIKSYLESEGVRPKKHLGQHFLHDHNQLRKLVDASGVGPGDLVLEVGPGTGTLTEALLEAGAEVIASEIDGAMTEILERHVVPKASSRLTIIRGDCLAGKRSLNPEIEKTLDRPFRLVANLPYQVASPLILVLLLDYSTRARDSARIDGLYITVQKEVAARILNGPGTKDYGPLSVLCQYLGNVRRIATLPPGSFWPPPGVDSAMIAITPQRDRTLERAWPIANAIQSIFQKRRKQLRSILGPGFSWPEGVDSTRRPEAMAPELLIEIARRASV